MLRGALQDNHYFRFTTTGRAMGAGVGAGTERVVLGLPRTTTLALAPVTLTNSARSYTGYGGLALLRQTDLWRGTAQLCTIMHNRAGGTACSVKRLPANAVKRF